MEITVISNPFRITLPSGTNLFGITKTEFLKNNNTLSNGITGYFIEINRTEFDQLNSSPGTARLTETFAAPGAGSPKFYKLVGIYNRDFDKKFIPGTLAGAELQQEFAKFNANSSQSPQLNTVVASAVNAVARNQNADPATVSASLFNSNTAGPSNPDQPTGQGGNPQAPGGDPPPAPTLPAPQQPDPVLLKVAGGVGSFLKYPKLMKDDQDKIKFTACEIQTRATPPLGGGLQTTFGKPTYKPIDGSVFLAIQSPISDQNSVDWGPDTVNAIDAALYNVSYGAITGGEGAVSRDIQSFLGNLYTTAQTGQGRFQRYLAGQAASINNILARTDNVVLNPNLELLFTGPQLRPFTFQFKMSARNQDEANEIKSIIKYFKYHMSVREEADKLFLKAPHVFTIQYLKGNFNSQPGINQISPKDFQKACALTNCSVDYTPLGSYSTYNDGTMVAYTLSLQFQEITPIYASDYVNYPHPIGF